MRSKDGITYTGNRCILHLIRKLQLLNLRSQMLTEIFFDFNLKRLKKFSTKMGGK
jgi:hypothetical protein